MSDYSPDSIFSSDPSYSTLPSSPPPGQPPPPPPPPPPFVCDDFNHCHANGHLGGVACDQVNRFICPGFPAGVLSFSGIQHPFPNIVQVCDWCANHEYFNNWNRIRSVANVGANTGNMIQLCHGCIRDEMELYWERNGTMVPSGPASAESLVHVDTWPYFPGPSLQNLCICINKTILEYRDYCHACRHSVWRTQVQDPRWTTEDILHERTKPVITGKKLCVTNGGTAQHRITNATRNKRVRDNIGRMCPCGEASKPNEPTLAQEYILICSACMGVCVWPLRLPARYQRANMQPRRRSPRNHVVTKRTKGPKKAERKSTWRVNIERGWVHDDPFVGGA
jgi:hypothetical protein